MEEDNRFYVYAYEDKEKTYYIGKGVGGRAGSHALDKRDQVTITTVAKGLTEEQALNVEAFLINRLPNLENAVQPTRFRRQATRPPIRKASPAPGLRETLTELRRELYMPLFALLLLVFLGITNAVQFGLLSGSPTLLYYAVLSFSYAMLLGLAHQMDPSKPAPISKGAVK